LRERPGATPVERAPLPADRVILIVAIVASGIVLPLAILLWPRRRVVDWALREAARQERCCAPDRLAALRDHPYALADYLWRELQNGMGPDPRPLQRGPWPL